MRKWFLLIFVSGLAIVIDQIAKLWVVNNLALGETVAILEALQPYLQFTHTSNTGFAFGLASGGSTVILILSSAITLVLIWMFSQSDESERLQQVALAIVIGGAIGNIIDRIRIGHVIDFFHITIPGLISNVSNFADHFVVFGVGLLLLDSFLHEQRQAKDKTTTPDEENIIVALDD